jgi:hypothetical protein
MFANGQPRAAAGLASPLLLLIDNFRRMVSVYGLFFCSGRNSLL